MIKLARRAGSQSCYMLARRASSMFARHLLDACLMSARCLFDVCFMIASCRLCFMHASYLLNVCLMFAPRLLDRVVRVRSLMLGLQESNTKANHLCNYSPSNLIYMAKTLHIFLNKIHLAFQSSKLCGTCNKHLC